jgi:hypothetical protein
MRRIIGLMLGAAIALAPAAGFARGGVFIGIAPPVPFVEPVPVAPSSGYVWQPGYWAWNGVQYVWVSGQYVVAPYPAAVWVPGAWIGVGAGWEWRPGHWRR